MKKIIILAILLVLAVTIITACSSETKIKTDEQAKETVSELSDDVDNLGKQLDEIDQQLG